MVARNAGPRKRLRRKKRIMMNPRGDHLRGEPLSLELIC
jgi:hypothetical protein